MNQLHLKAEFEQVLGTYSISSEGRQVLESVNFVGVTGISAGGKNTIFKELLKTGRYEIIVSDTTRQLRTNAGVPERNGVEYWFRSEEKVLADLRAGLYIEAELIHGQQVSGISIRELSRVAKNHKIAITDIDPQGVTNILAAKPSTTIVFPIPPNFNIWLERLRARGELEKDEIKRRMETALQVFEYSKKHAENIHCVINDDLQVVTAHIDEIVLGRRTSLLSKNSFALALINELEVKAKEFLQS